MLRAQNATHQDPSEHEGPAVSGRVDVRTCDFRTDEAKEEEREAQGARAGAGEEEEEEEEELYVPAAEKQDDLRAVESREAMSDGDDSFDEIDLKYLNASLIAKIRSGAEVTINGKRI
eukprot:758883-Hanusia_phi.AAC.3